MSEMSAPPTAAPANPATADLSRELQRHFGYARFRPGQEAIVRSVLEGRPTIAILPTGGGKSLCFQLPALLLPGTTVVASPLVALMKDQVDQLCARGIAATFINSSLSEADRQERQAQLRRGAYRLVYVAPERFRSKSFLQALAQVRVPLLAVDEAHCISAWGHDFRPDYQRLAAARTQINAERVLALTATATAEVRRDIAQALQLDHPRVFVAGFDRPNLFIEICKASGDKDKLGRLLALARRGGQGIVYAATRRNVEKIVAALCAHGIDALGYHAGMEDAERTAAQERFLRGQAQVIVATNAFGMGVDKPDIRFVAHFDVPRSVEAYYQEIGRAGRDGEPSFALLLFNFADVMLQRRLIDSGRASEASIRAIWSAAVRLGQGTQAELARAAKAEESEVAAAVRLLESAGHLERSRARGPAAQFAVVRPDAAGPELQIDFGLLALRVERERKMLDRMVRLADTSGCRRVNLLRYFGDADVPHGCSACDNCAGARAPAAVPVGALRASKAGARKGAPARSGGARGGGKDAAGDAAEAPYDERVFAALRALRTEIAREARVPPYVVFPDATLRELSRARPSSEGEFLAVKGAGPARWKSYGERVLAITSPAAAAYPPPAPPREGRVSDSVQAPLRAAPASVTPPWLLEGPPPVEEPASEVARAPGSAAADALSLSQQGVSLAEIARRTGLPAFELASQLAQARSRGAPIDAERLLGRERVAAIRAAAAGCDGDLVAVRRKLPFAAQLAEIRLALL